jgi:hypothetical protein
MGLLRIGTHGSKLHTLVEIQQDDGDCRLNFYAVDCAQIVPVKVKFSQIFPKITKIAVKISCIINMLKLRSFWSNLIYDLKSLTTMWYAGSTPAPGTIK